MKQLILLFVIAISITSPVMGLPDDATPPAGNSEAKSTSDAASTAEETARQAEELIYSVSRSPERLFDAARSVEVITAEEIRRRSGRGLADIVAESAGVYMRRTLGGGGAAVIRGLSTNQVLILVDGIKLTNGTWGEAAADYLNLVDVHQIERVEIVRGVVSVLGTESLGGIINIITKKGPQNGEAISGTIGLRYSSADAGLTIPLTLAGQTGKLRYSAGISLRDADDLRGGGDVGEQDVSGYQQQSGFASVQYLLSMEKTLTAAYSDVESSDVRVLAPGLTGPVFFKPDRTRLASVSFADLTSRRWADSFRASAYWNRQTSGAELIVTTPWLNIDTFEADTLTGASLEGGKFLGRSHVHHLVYGIDFSSEETDSQAIETDAAGHIAMGRGATMAGAKYQTIGVYLNDRFDIGKRLTATIGGRFGVFSLKGRENSVLGPLEIDSRESDFATSLNLVYHVTPSLNLIGNAIQGFRTPNLFDTTTMSWGTNTVLIPSAQASVERVKSYELGAKYESARFSGSAFAFRNDLANLLVASPGTLNGLPFYDTNYNRQQDPWETISILQNRNVGSGTIEGFELDGRLRLGSSFTVRSHYTHTVGTDTASNTPFPLIPPAFGAVTLQYTPATKHGMWGELIYSFASSREGRADRAVAATPAMQVFGIRGGITLAERVDLTLEIENLFDEEYRSHGANVHEAGRQFIVSTQYRF